MSFDETITKQFADALIGRTTTFVVEKSSNLEFARAATRLFASGGYDCVILDLDAFYSSNSDRIFTMPGLATTSTAIRVPDPNSSIQGEVSKLFEAREKVIVVDSLNTLYHLLAQEDESSHNRSLGFAIEALSYLARNDSKAVILAMYRRTGFPRHATGRSISALSDSTVSLEIDGKGLKFTDSHGATWPRGAAPIRIP